MEKKDKDIFEHTTKFNTGIRLYMFQTGSIKTKVKFHPVFLRWNCNNVNAKDNEGITVATLAGLNRRFMKKAVKC